MSNRRLETRVEQLKAQTTGQLAEIGRKTAAINQLKGELVEKASAIFALEAPENMLRGRLGELEAELATKAATQHAGIPLLDELAVRRQRPVAQQSLRPAI